MENINIHEPKFAYTKQLHQHQHYTNLINTRFHQDQPMINISIDEYNPKNVTNTSVLIIKFQHECTHINEQNGKCLIAYLWPGSNGYGTNTTSYYKDPIFYFHLSNPLKLILFNFIKDVNNAYLKLALLNFNNILYPHLF
jgi:hypothetical protein